MYNTRLSSKLDRVSRDEKWVKNWFVRQRSKLAARNRKSQLAGHSVTVPTFKVQLCQPQGMPSPRSVSTPIEPAPCLPSPASLESRSPCPSPATPNSHATPRSQRSVSASLSPNSPSQKPIPTYSRDPLSNRYPDFSQFFRSQVYERFSIFQLSAPISNYNHLVQLVANPGMDSHVPIHVQNLLNLVYPLHLGGIPTDQTSSTNMHPCPVAFPMRLVDLLDHSSLMRHPVVPLPELEYPI